MEKAIVVAVQKSMFRLRRAVICTAAASCVPAFLAYYNYVNHRPFSAWLMLLWMTAQGITIYFMLKTIRAQSKFINVSGVSVGDEGAPLNGGV